MLRLITNVISTVKDWYQFNRLYKLDASTQRWEEVVSGYETCLNAWDIARKQGSCDVCIGGECGNYVSTGECTVALQAIQDNNDEYDDMIADRNGYMDNPGEDDIPF